jgi:hypothetical protein
MNEKPIQPESQQIIHLIESQPRQDVNAIDKAQIIRLILSEGEETAVSLANKLGLSERRVKELDRLNELPKCVQDAVEQNRISCSHAVYMLRLLGKGLMANEWEAVVKLAEKPLPEFLRLLSRVKFDK